MSSLKQLTVEHLRGAVAPFSLPFEKGKKLTVIYGENGTGKSTICDALELLGRGEVHSLENRGLGQTHRYWASQGKAIVDISVTMEAADGSCRAKVSRNGDVIFDPPENQPFVEVFRRSQILSLIDATPAGRYAAISRFIDVSGVEASEKTLRDLIRELKDTQKLATAGLTENERVVRQYWENAGTPGNDPFAWAEEECGQELGLFEAEGAALHALQMAYARLAGVPESMRNAQAVAKSADNAFAEAATALDAALRKTSREAAEVVAVLRAAQTYLVKAPSSQVCPVCESSENTEHLSDRIENRLSAFSALREAQSRVDTARQQADRAAQHFEGAKSRAREEVARFEETLDAYPWPKGVQLPPRPVPSTLAGLETWLKNSMELSPAWKVAENQRYERKQFIKTLQQAVNTWKQNRRAQIELANLLPGLERALAVMMDERRRFTDDILGAISAEVGRLYEAVHPGEGLNKISMELDARKRASLDLAASFGGQVAPPAAFFSDSHLDTLGLCVLLALAALDEPERKILVLDDVLGSVDEPHVDRLIEMLHTEAAHFRHCILTTHYRPWREKFRWGWLRSGQCQFVELGQWGPQIGMTLTRSVPDNGSLERLLKEKSPDLQAICSKAVVILEAALSFLTTRYECPVPRRPGGAYTLGDLLLALDNKLVQALRVDVQTGNDGNGKPAYRTVSLNKYLEELSQIAQTRNILGCHFNEISFHLLNSDALTFGRLVFDLMAVLTDGDTGWPGNGKSGEYWATAGETRRLHPFTFPAPNPGSRH